MNRRGFLGRLVAAIGLAPLLKFIPRDPEPDFTVSCKYTGSFSNNMRVEFMPGSVWVDGDVAYMLVTASNGETIWVAPGTYILNSTN